ncbi:hypothetical protein ACQPW1_09940 [Nocardia sp. CA-128927]|uniref:hypothetical protein n=1 Tax=Nocardia sp. CA-128927 TaxID=3239975 RepID=UPI003D996BDD
MAGTLGANALSKISIGATEIQTISLGTAVLWTGVKFEPVKAVLGSSFNPPTSYGQVLGWSADTGNFPKSAVTSNRLVVPNPGKGVTISAALVITGPQLGSTDATLRLNIDGATVTGTTTTIGQNDSGTAVVSATNRTLNAGSLISLDAQATVQHNGFTSSAPASTSSFIYAYIP